MSYEDAILYKQQRRKVASALYNDKKMLHEKKNSGKRSKPSSSAVNKTAQLTKFFKAGSSTSTMASAKQSQPLGQPTLNNWLLFLENTDQMKMINRCQAGCLIMNFPRNFP